MDAKAAAESPQPPQPRARLTESDAAAESSGGGGPAGTAEVGLRGKEAPPANQGPSEEQGTAAGERERGASVSAAAGQGEKAGGTSSRYVREGGGEAGAGDNDDGSDVLVAGSDSDEARTSVSLGDADYTREMGNNRAKGKKVQFSGIADEEEVGESGEEKDMSSGEEEREKDKALAIRGIDSGCVGVERGEGGSAEENKRAESELKQEAAHERGECEEAEKLNHPLIATIPPTSALASQKVTSTSQDPVLAPPPSVSVHFPTSPAPSTTDPGIVRNAEAPAPGAAALALPPAAVFSSAFDSCLPRTGEARLNSFTFGAAVPMAAESRSGCIPSGAQMERGEGSEGVCIVESRRVGESDASLNTESRGEEKGSEGRVRAAVRVLDGKANGGGVGVKERGGDGKAKVKYGVTDHRLAQQRGESKAGAGAVVRFGEKATGEGGGEGKAEEKESKGVEAPAGSSKRRPLKKGTAAQ